MINIILADDHEVIRDGLKLILENTNDIRLKKGVSSGMEVVNELKVNSNYQIVVLDIIMEGKNIFDVIEDIKNINENLPIIIFSMNNEEQYALRLLNSGASGYVCKTSGTERLIEAIRKVIKGGKYYSDNLSLNLIQNFGNKDKQFDHHDLSNREFQILVHIAQGDDLTTISNKLFIGKSTISNYRSNILKKLNLKNNSDLTKYAYVNGIIE